MAVRMTLKRLRAMRESSDQDKTEWRHDNGVQDPLTRELAKINKAAAKARRANAKLGKKFRKS